MEAEEAELLFKLQSEAYEHKRVWGLVEEVTVWLTEKLNAKPTPSSDQQKARIAQLEQRIVKQKEALHKLEECREFERGTEQLLAQTLQAIVPFTKGDANARVRRALEAYEKRKGPRPQGADAS